LAPDGRFSPHGPAGPRIFAHSYRSTPKPRPWLKHRSKRLRERRASAAVDSPRRHHSKVCGRAISEVTFIDLPEVPSGDIPEHSRTQSYLLVVDWPAQALVTAGHGFVDAGDGHVVRNESDQPAQDISVITAPVGGAFRTNLPANANPACGF